MFKERGFAVDSLFILCSVFVGSLVLFFLSLSSVWEKLGLFTVVSSFFLGFYTALFSLFDLLQNSFTQKSPPLTITTNLFKVYYYEV